MHLHPSSSAAATWSYKYARDVVVGDTVHVLDGQGQGVGEALVARVSLAVERGLYNPLVFGGKLACWLQPPTHRGRE